MLRAKFLATFLRRHIVASMSRFARLSFVGYSMPLGVMVKAPCWRRLRCDLPAGLQVKDRSRL